MCAGEDVLLIRRVRVLLTYRTDRADVARVVALVRLNYERPWWNGRDEARGLSRMHLPVTARTNGGAGQG
jgi:hypothetical protein